MLGLVHNAHRLIEVICQCPQSGDQPCRTIKHHAVPGLGQQIVLGRTPANTKR